MLSLTLRALRARPLRLVLSALAVTLSVAFLAGVMVFSHGLSSTFHRIVDGATPDAVVRAESARGLGETAVPDSSLDPALVRRLAQLPQVARADGQVQALGVSLLDADGRAVGGAGGPTLAVSHDDAPNMDGGQALHLLSGRWPQGLAEVVLDEDAARDAGYRVGDQVSLLTPASDRAVHLRLVGTAEFDGGGTIGAKLVVLSPAGAQHLLLHDRDVFTRIALTAAPGVSQAELVSAAQVMLPAGFQAVTGDEVAQQSQDAIGSFLDAISAFLLIFAIVAVVVSAFIIVNTFTIVVAQRTQELALLRALGASRPQVRRSVLAEAVVVGVVASTLGIGLGWLLARALAAVFGSFGLSLGTAALVLTPGAVAGGYAVGVGVTVVAAYLPARRAGRIAPIAVLRREQASPMRPSLLRVLCGLVGLLLGAGSAYVGLADVHPRPGAPAVWVGVAGVVWIVAGALLVPTLGRPLLVLCRASYAVFGVAGRLAGDNALRDPRRTGATASALMIGLALVSVIAVLAASLDATIDDTVDERFAADFRVQATGAKPFATTVGDRIERLPGVAAVSREEDLPGLVDGGWAVVAGVDARYLDTHALTVGDGNGVLTAGSALVSRSYADDHDVAVGQQLGVAVVGRTLPVRVTGIVDGGHDVPQVMVPLGALVAAGVPRQDTVLSVALSPGADEAAVREQLDRAVASTPYLSVDDRREFADQLHSRVDKLVDLVYGLLALAVVIAVLGIVNTLSLSVVERTRELGLLRAVGMSRAQVRRMVTLESVAIALLGAALGLGLGVLIGVLLRRSLADSLSSVAVPVTGLMGFVGVAVVIGVLAAVGPGIRAARMSPLEAAAD